MRGAAWRCCRPCAAACRMRSPRSAGSTRRRAFRRVTIAVSRGKPVGVADGSGVMIGLEALCATDWLSANVEDRFVHVIAHEYGHVEQLRAVADDENPTVLQASLVEGGAELVAELISGEVGYPHLAAMTKGHEREIEGQFVPDEDKTDLSRWLYNSSYEKPGDLGYWVGYRIVKSYYQHAADKRRALREILEMTDPKVLLAGERLVSGHRARADEVRTAGATRRRTIQRERDTLVISVAASRLSHPSAQLTFLHPRVRRRGVHSFTSHGCL